MLPHCPPRQITKFLLMRMGSAKFLLNEYGRLQKAGARPLFKENRARLVALFARQGNHQS